jgi:hypothetical protein
MIKALVFKELREIYGIAAIALAVGLMLVSGLIGFWPFAALVTAKARVVVPFADATFSLLFGAIAGAAGIALGFRQSAWEAWQGTYQFLLHRPLRREAIFLTKMATGIVTLAACTALPLSLYVWWIAVPSHQSAPFEWSMTAPAWLLCVTMPLMYLAAFLCGLRPARWYGTRLLPLIGTAVPVIFVFTPLCSWRLGVPLLLVLYVLLSATILYVARTRDYS